MPDRDFAEKHRQGDYQSKLNVSADVAQQCEKRLLKHVPVYFLKATQPCVVAYAYDRIRRLVRPEVAR